MLCEAAPHRTTASRSRDEKTQCGMTERIEIVGSGLVTCRRSHTWLLLHPQAPQHPLHGIHPRARFSVLWLFYTRNGTLARMPEFAGFLVTWFERLINACDAASCGRRGGPCTGGLGIPCHATSYSSLSSADAAGGVHLLVAARVPTCSHLRRRQIASPFAVSSAEDGGGCRHHKPGRKECAEL